MGKLIELNVIKNLINKNDTIALAVSGGSDSMAMLYWFIENQNSLAIDFFVVNFEHGIRGESSINDSDFVKKYCDKNNIECLSIQFDTPKYAKENGLTIEQAGRLLRYKNFNDLIKNKKANKIALAHHKQDQVETVLMRIFRGTGINGLKGIEMNRDNIYIRPLLNTPKDAIMKFIADNNIEYVDDETNFETEYTRNFIRNELLPMARKKFGDVDTAIFKLSEIAKETEDYLSRKAPSIIELEKNVYAIKIEDLNEKVLASIAILKCFNKLGINYDIEKRHIDLIYDLKNKQNGSKLDMPYFISVYKEYDKLVFTKTKNNDIDFKPIMIKLPFNKTIMNDKVKIESYNGKIEYGKDLYFDLDKLPDNILLRRKEPNDVFTKFGGITKSLSDYLTDKKIPLRKRADLFVGARQNMVYFIVGIEISDLIKIDNESKNIYRITLEDLNE